MGCYLPPRPFRREEEEEEEEEEAEDRAALQQYICAHGHGHARGVRVLHLLS